ncbi:HNH endonuclease [Mycolicibacillus trivialis]
MAVSKRLRYEILRRDNHQCRYCGATAPGTPLTIDHVIPVALGGTDEPANLVTACRDCNAGKTSSSPDNTLVETVSDDALRWAKAMERAANERAQERQQAADTHGQFITEWEAWTNSYGKTTPIPRSWPATVDQLLAAGLDMTDLHELITVAMESKANDTWRYFCGCCWTRIRQLQERAQEIVAGAEPSQVDRPFTTRWTLQEVGLLISELEDVVTLTHGRSLDEISCSHGKLTECGDGICYLIHLTEWSVHFNCRKQFGAEVFEVLEQVSADHARKVGSVNG